MCRTIMKLTKLIYNNNNNNNNNNNGSIKRSVGGHTKYNYSIHNLSVDNCTASTDEIDVFQFRSAHKEPVYIKVEEKTMK